MDSVGARWFNALTDFYSQFERTFSRQWKAVLEDEHLLASSWKPESTPSLWKVNGDELIYVHNVTHPNDLVLALLSWQKALLSYREQLDQRPFALDVKATAWMAGFPIGNHEVAFWSDLSKNSESTDEPPGKAGQYYRLNQWYKDQNNAQKSDYIKDYIGPAVDTGFRISQFASARKFPVSIEIAYFLSKSAMEPEAIKQLKLRYHGRAAMKGVLGGLPYPVFWIDCVSPSDALTNAEDGLANPGKLCEPDDVSKFVDAFFSDTKNKLFPPFIYDGSEKKFSRPPNKYTELLHHISNVWKKELEKHRTQVASILEEEAPDESDAVEANKDDIDKLSVGAPSKTK